MDIFGYIKVGKRISKAHKALFTNKTMVLWYKGNPIIGTMHDGLWYQQDLNGMLEQLMFQSEVTHVSFLPSPNEDWERKNPIHHRWYSGRAWSCSHRAAPRPHSRNHQSRMPSALSSHQWIMRRRQDKLVPHPQRYGIHYQKTINSKTIWNKHHSHNNC